jgi:hypothetical protein
MEELEAALRILEDRMNTHEEGFDMTVVEKHANLTKQLNQAMDEWASVSEELEELVKTIK